jgi:hypothetical protein
MLPQLEVPHEGAFQVTPAPVASHDTDAVSIALPPNGTGFGEIVAVTAIGMISTTALTDFVLS